MLAALAYADPWRFQPNYEVYVLVAFLIGAYVYSLRVIGPRAVAPGESVVSRRQVFYFVAAMTILFTASTWPIHQIGEEYLYCIHMLQHMMLAYFLPPLVLLATPEWLLRLIVGRGRTYRMLTWLTKPVVAGVLFNVTVMTTHIPGVVNRSTVNGPLHYSLHFLLVMTALLMWMPVIGPFKELHMGYGGKMIYLFAQSVVPTVPAGWLTFAEGVVYKHYDTPVRVWGLGVQDDQQLAGAIMKIGGGIYLWTVIAFMFFRRFGMEKDEAPLTYEDIAQEFERTPPPVTEHH